MPQQQSLARFFSASGGNSRKKAKLDESVAKTPETPETPATPVTPVEVIKKEDVVVEEIKKDAEDESIPVKTEVKKVEVEKKINTGGVIPYAKITEVFENVENTSSRLSITALVSDLYLEILKTSTPKTLAKVVYLCINRLGPDYEPDLELGLGETLLIKAISECYGRAPAKTKREYQEVGDLGLVAQKSRSGQPTMFKQTSLDVDMVFENLTKIARSTGKDSQSRKISIINKMLTACNMKSNEAKFLIRSLEGKLRIGLAEKTVLMALAQAFVNYEKITKNGKKVGGEDLAQAEDVIREAFSTIPNYEIIIENAYKYGVFNLLEHCQLTPGIPLKPMLAKPTKSVSEILDRFQGEEFTCEYKYDGERAQIHFFDNQIKVYSRNSEDMSQRYPDLLNVINEVFKSTNGGAIVTNKSMILDCEVVAWDKEQGKILPFQVLSTRKRKAVEEKDIKVNICLFIFDMLYFNNTALISRSLTERRELMMDNLQVIDGKFQFATYKNSTNLDELQLFLDQSVKDSCEGLMVKMLNGKESYYEPSKRSRNWLKLKKDYLAGVGDSLDLVVVGAYIGKGKRTGTYGGFLLASYNQDTGEYETTCKIGTGFSDEMLTTLYNQLKPTEIPRPKAFYVYDSNNSNASPDVWFEPTTIFEVLTADLSLSPVYKAAHNEYGKGISLRFPRFIRLRDDKSIEDATSSEQISEFYQRQASVN
ncbi:DNA ligase 1 [[Candida] anglica]|uniref:DNA ligase n=1 Tax=[Candida] anglica TaxID=148631 RepID=A0ABP0EF51_9ASCO